MPARRIAGPRLASAMIGLSTMHAAKPHYLLCTETVTMDGAPRWSFVLQPVGRDETFSASDSEPTTKASRLELLAVVRGLEALDQPSRVTLLTSSKYVCRGLRRELQNWRDRRWRWERFGQLVPINDHDLWQRVDRALQFHQVECFTSHSEEPEGAMSTAWRGHVSSAPHDHSGQWAGHTLTSLPRMLGRVVQAVVEILKPKKTAERARDSRPNRVFSPNSAVFRTPFTKAA